MVKIPLFPLNMVLLPGLPVQLNIFEPRYHEMIDYCLDSDLPFGVVLIREGREVGDPPPEIYTRGTAAEIVSVEEHNTGNLNLTARGQQKFDIIEIDNSRSFMQAEVEMLPTDNDPSPALEKQRDRLHNLLEKYLRLNPDYNHNIDFSNFLSPLSFAALCTTAMHLPLNEKQHLLEINEDSIFISRVTELLEPEIKMVSSLAAQRKNNSMGPFSKN